MDEFVVGPNTSIRLRRACERNRLDVLVVGCSARRTHLRADASHLLGPRGLAHREFLVFRVPLSLLRARILRRAANIALKRPDARAPGAVAAK